jgi:serine protease Do
VTNEHVARNATELYVTFLSEQETGTARQFNVPGRVLALDQRVDLAIVAVETAALAESGLEPAQVSRMRLWTGEPADLQQGAPLQALGNPLGLKRVMTTGVVSAPLQELPAYPWLPPLRAVQTDAAINKGNSGGPLMLTATGEVVAVNFLGVGQNINFAIPARRVRTLLAHLACGRGIRHGDLPFFHLPVDGRIRSALDLHDVAGEVVLDPVGPRGDIVEAVQPLDIVLGVTGRLQAEAGGGDAQFRIGPGGFPLSEAVFDFEPGSEVVLVIHRAGEQIEARMRLTTLDPQSAEQEDQIKFLGAYLERVADWKRSGTRYDGSGLICGHVSPGSIAAQAGLQKQDIVERVMFRASDTFSVVDVTNVAALQEAAPQILAEIRRARSSGASVVLGLETYNLESRARKVKLLRTAPLLD